MVLLINLLENVIRLNSRFGVGHVSLLAHLAKGNVPQVIFVSDWPIFLNLLLRNRLAK
jgi:hypothetical protein